MKSTTISFLIAFFPVLICAQPVTVKLRYPGEAYACVSNLLEVKARGLASEALQVETNNGSIGLFSSKFYWHPKSVGDSKIYVKKRIKGKAAKCLDSFSYTVKRVPIKADVGGRGSGDIDHEQLLMTLGIGLVVKNRECMGGYSILEYTVDIRQKDKELFRSVEDGRRRISDSIRYIFSQLRNGDVVSFINIKTRDCLGIRPADSLVLTVTNAHKYVRRFVKDTVVTDVITSEEEHIYNKYYYNKAD